MIQVVFHLADLHIRTFNLHDLYKRQFEKLITDLKSKSKDFKYNEIRIVIAGDIAHQKINVSNEQIILTSWLLNQLSKIGKVVIIPGNHDFLENNVQRIDSITPIVELLNNKNIIYYKDMGVYDDDNVKWVVYSLYQHNQRPEFEKEDGFHYVGLFHGPIQGSSTDVGYTFEDGYDKINFRGCDIVMCGDIHKMQKLYYNDTPIIFPGSCIQQNFGETVNHHGYGIYIIQTKEYTTHEIENEQPFLHFSISDIKDIEDEKEELLNIR